MHNDNIQWVESLSYTGNFKWEGVVNTDCHINPVEQPVSHPEGVKTCVVLLTSSSTPTKMSQWLIQTNTYFWSDLVFSSNILIHLLSLDMRLCSLLAPGELKSKSLANCALSLWKAGSWAAAWARLASVSWERGPPTLPAEARLLCSRPMPNVLTNLCTNWIISGDMRALVTVSVREWMKCV